MDRRLCRQARRAAPRIDGRPVRLVAASLSGRLDRGGPSHRPGPRRAAGGRRLSRGGGRASRRRAPGVDRIGAANGSRGTTVTTVPLAFYWGDDELSAARALDRFETALSTEAGAPLERWLVRGDRNSAAGILADLNERVATPVMFGGGTLAVVLNAGALTVKNEDRDAFIGLLEVVAPGNALAILDASQSAARGPTPKRLADAIAAAGGAVRQFKAPKEGALAGWIEGEARERGLALAAGAAKALAERVGGFVREGDTERTYQTRLASMELDKLALYRGGEPIRPEDVEALVAEAVPGSVWAFTDAIGERRVERALGWLDRLFESTAEAVLLAVLHRRIRELIETGDRVAAGERLAAVGRAMGIASEFRMEKLRDQAKLWSTPELVGALDGLVELDAMVKGMPGAERNDAQRRLAFSLWVTGQTRRGRPAGGGP